MECGVPLANGSDSLNSATHFEESLDSGTHFDESLDYAICLEESLNSASGVQINGDSTICPEESLDSVACVQNHLPPDTQIQEESSLVPHVQEESSLAPQVQEESNLPPHAQEESESTTYILENSESTTGIEARWDPSTRVQQETSYPEYLVFECSVPLLRLSAEEISLITTERENITDTDDKDDRFDDYRKQRMLFLARKNNKPSGISDSLDKSDVDNDSDYVPEENISTEEKKTRKRKYINYEVDTDWVPGLKKAKKGKVDRSLRVTTRRQRIESCSSSSSNGKWSSEDEFFYGSKEDYMRDDEFPQIEDDPFQQNGLTSEIVQSEAADNSDANLDTPDPHDEQSCRARDGFVDNDVVSKIISEMEDYQKKNKKPVHADDSTNTLQESTVNPHDSATNPMTSSVNPKSSTTNPKDSTTYPKKRAREPKSVVKVSTPIVNEVSSTLNNIIGSVCPEAKKKAFLLYNCKTCNAFMYSKDALCEVCTKPKKKQRLESKIKKPKSKMMCKVLKQLPKSEKQRLTYSDKPLEKGYNHCKNQDFVTEMQDSSANTNEQLISSKTATTKKKTKNISGEIEQNKSKRGRKKKLDTDKQKKSDVNVLDAIREMSAQKKLEQKSSNANPTSIENRNKIVATNVDKGLYVLNFPDAHNELDIFPTTTKIISQNKIVNSVKQLNVIQNQTHNILEATKNKDGAIPVTKSAEYSAIVIATVPSMVVSNFFKPNQDSANFNLASVYTGSLPTQVQITSAPSTTIAQSPATFVRSLSMPSIEQLTNGTAPTVKNVSLFPGMSIMKTFQPTNNMVVSNIKLPNTNLNQNMTVQLVNTSSMKIPSSQQSVFAGSTAKVQLIGQPMVQIPQKTYQHVQSNVVLPKVGNVVPSQLASLLSDTPTGQTKHMAQSLPSTSLLNQIIPDESDLQSMNTHFNCSSATQNKDLSSELMQNQENVDLQDPDFRFIEFLRDSDKYDKYLEHYQEDLQVSLTENENVGDKMDGNLEPAVDEQNDDPSISDSSDDEQLDESPDDLSLNDEAEARKYSLLEMDAHLVYSIIDLEIVGNTNDPYTEVKRKIMQQMKGRIDTIKKLKEKLSLSSEEQEKIKKSETSLKILKIALRIHKQYRSYDAFTDKMAQEETALKAKNNLITQRILSSSNTQPVPSTVIQQNTVVPITTPTPITNVQTNIGNAPSQPLELSTSSSFNSSLSVQNILSRPVSRDSNDSRQTPSRGSGPITPSRPDSANTEVMTPAQIKKEKFEATNAAESPCALSNSSQSTTSVIPNVPPAPPPYSPTLAQPFSTPMQYDARHSASPSFNTLENIAPSYSSAYNTPAVQSYSANNLYSSNQQLMTNNLYGGQSLNPPQRTSSLSADMQAMGPPNVTAPYNATKSLEILLQQQEYSSGQPSQQRQSINAYSRQNNPQQMFMSGSSVSVPASRMSQPQARDVFKTPTVTPPSPVGNAPVYPQSSSKELRVYDPMMPQMAQAQMTQQQIQMAQQRQVHMAQQQQARVAQRQQAQLLQQQQTQMAQQQAQIMQQQAQMVQQQQAQMVQQQQAQMVQQQQAQMVQQQAQMAQQQQAQMAQQQQVQMVQQQAQMAQQQGQLPSNSYMQNNQNAGLLDMTCAQCGKVANLRCKQCAKVAYCDTLCARKFWHTRHKMECLKYR